MSLAAILHVKPLKVKLLAGFSLRGPPCKVQLQLGLELQAGSEALEVVKAKVGKGKTTGFDPVGFCRAQGGVGWGRV